MQATINVTEKIFEVLSGLDGYTQSGGIILCALLVFEKGRSVLLFIIGWIDEAQEKYDDERENDRIDEQERRNKEEMESNSWW